MQRKRILRQLRGPAFSVARFAMDSTQIVSSHPVELLALEENPARTL
jgi:hypothetical protein